MSAYAVFTREKTLDESELKVYHESAKRSPEGHPVRPLASYGHQETLEGSPSEGTVILEFPDMEAAKAWYNDPKTIATREHRLKGGTYQSVLVQGVQKA
jgi:uncharacterized protein (DUF1330 family)